MNSIIDQQKEFTYGSTVLDREWVQKRIGEQFVYILEIYSSDRTVERKMELIGSAFGIIKQYMEVYEDFPMAMVVAYMAANAVSQMRMLGIKPRPYFKMGGDNVQEITVSVPYNRLDSSGDVHAPGCFKNSIEKLNGKDNEQGDAFLIKVLRHNS